MSQDFGLECDVTHLFGYS